MAKKKTEDEMIISEEITAETDFDDIAEASQQSEADTEPQPEISETEKTGVFITLKKGGSYRFRDYVFKQNVPASVDEEIADRLMKTGFFERND